jgi:hypothetical protein
MKEVVQLLLSVLLYLFWGFFLFRSELSQLPSSFFLCFRVFPLSEEKLLATPILCFTFFVDTFSTLLVCRNISP